MTGGQPVDGIISVDGIARQVEAEGVKQVMVLSDDIAKYDAIRNRFPAGHRVPRPRRARRVQRRLREMPASRS
jgi:indolepyruvate ferredoxin oxidoreductase